ncbi:hypothetical protein [Pseudoduganella sp. GCM10020061]|uniref:hypothetical protein n=1 Tax=Pseudoduganella sp. GCM10020061 TaxID=3317345 RepID=UPI003635E9A9
MKNLILAAAVFAGAILPAAAQTNVSVTIGQPGFYGRIDIGDYAAPPVLISQPVIIEREVRYVAEPVYLRVPPGHRKNWARYCRRYEACGRPVYFVRDDWYLNEYAPRYRERHYREVRRDYYDDRRHYADGYRDGRREERRDDRRDYRDHDRHDGHGKGKHKDKGHGHGNGHGRGH